MKKIILVDDEPLALERLRNILNRYNDFEIVGEYLNGMDAIEGIKSLKPDIVVTDICMAELDGLNMIKKIEEDTSCNIGVIIVSGYDRFDYAKRALKLGVGDYLLKPVIEDEFIEALNEVSVRLDEKTDDITEEMMQKDIVNAEIIVDAVLAFDIERLKALFYKIDIAPEYTDRFCRLVFALLDSRSKNEQFGYQNIWNEYNSEKINIFTHEVRDKMQNAIMQCMLAIMEKDGYDKKHPTEYIRLYVMQNYKEDISMTWFAERLYVNVAYLGQKFKKENGQSVNSFLNRTRIDKAKELADCTNMTWAEIAEEVGYRSYISFSDNFIKAEGRTPSEYRG